MTKYRKVYIIITIFIITAFSLYFIIEDFSRFFASSGHYNAFLSDVLKRINVLLTALMVWTIGNSAFSKRDSSYMKIVFIVICFGEAALYYGFAVEGIIFFAVCQILLSIRNGRGLREKLFSSNQNQKNHLYIMTFIIIIIPLLTILAFHNMLEFNMLFTVACSYGALLSLSLWMGLANCILGFMPKPNSWMIAIGMVCFYFCDINVGLDAAIQPSLIQLIADSSIWVFYTPAIVLLALSCYKYKSVD